MISNWDDIDLTLGGGDNGFFGFLSEMSDSNDERERVNKIDDAEGRER